MPKQKILTIIGPTASGKTDFAFRTAQFLKEKYNKEVEIISADSRQVYKYIPVATAQPPVEFLNKTRHHFISELELNEEFNAGEFGKKGREIIQKLLSENKISIVSGGSGLYINSLIYGLFENDDARDFPCEDKKKTVRSELNQRLADEGVEKLFAELKCIDPLTAGEMINITGRRVIRALEAFYVTGIPISSLRNDKIEINFEPVIIGLLWERKKLYDRINKRVEQMIETGLVKEIEILKEKGYNYKDYNSLNTVGAREVFDYLDRKISYDRMIELIKQNTRRYAKRQMTWFRRDKNIRWIEIDSNFHDLETLF